MLVCMNTCTYVCMWNSVDVRMFVCLFVGVDVWMGVCVLYVIVCMWMCACVWYVNLYMFMMCESIAMCMCVRVCVCECCACMLVTVHNIQSFARAVGRGLDRRPSATDRAAWRPSQSHHVVDYMERHTIAFRFSMAVIVTNNKYVLILWHCVNVTSTDDVVDGRKQQEPKK